MNRRRLRRVLIMAVAAAICLAMVVFSSAAEKNSGARLTLWYDEGECSPAVMEALAALCQSEARLRIELRSFPDEAAMGLAFEEERPDLVYCSASRAAGFEKCASLGAVGDALPLSEGLRTLSPEIGESFFPIGGRLPLLLMNTALVTQTHDTLESLLTAADGSAFIASDDWAELLYTAMCAEGAPVTGDPAEDTNNKTFRRLYNQLAEAAFRGGLVISEQSADYVRQGLIPCAVVRSTSIAGLADRDVYVRPLLLPAGTEPQYPAELMGFALPEGADTAAAAGFLSWLYGGKAVGKAALALGLVPLWETPEAETGLDTALIGLSRSGLVRWCVSDTAFFRNRELCERWLDETLNMLR